MRNLGWEQSVDQGYTRSASAFSRVLALRHRSPFSPSQSRLSPQVLPISTVLLNTPRSNSIMSSGLRILVPVKRVIDYAVSTLSLPAKLGPR